MKIALIGLPGSGKTTIAKALSTHFGVGCVDLDDDILETEWNCTVAEKLEALGDSAFLLAEDDTLVCSRLVPEAGILSLSGSSPLLGAGMARLAAAGWQFVWLDVWPGDILQRLGRMKVDRIVGQAARPLSSVLQERLPHYQAWSGLRVLCGPGWDAATVLRHTLTQLECFLSPDSRLYTSTRATESASRADLSEVVLAGLAGDGGLYLPARLPAPLSPPELGRLTGLGYTARATALLQRLLPACPPAALRRMVGRAYGEQWGGAGRVVPVTTLQPRTHLAELFHGPSGSFKDLALQFTPQLVSLLLKERAERCLVLVATSGDTGSAVLEGFGQFGGENIAVLVLFPTVGVSAVQRHQMTTVSRPNVKVLAVTGDFDDCQRMVKRMFEQKEFLAELRRRHNLRINTANSINWARLVPQIEWGNDNVTCQIVYHCHIYLELVDSGAIQLGDRLDCSIPSGNFGNALSGLLAKRLGLPYGDIIVASNENNVLTDFFTTGTYDLRERKLSRTISPAIDILVSSNLERWLGLQLGPARVSQLYSSLTAHRWFQLTAPELERVRSGLRAGWAPQSECRAAVRATLSQSDYLLDPHTAVAAAVAERLRCWQTPLVILSTAHHSKFGPDLQAELGGREVDSVGRPGPHPGIAACLEREVVHTEEIAPHLSELEQVVKNFVNAVSPN